MDRKLFDAANAAKARTHFCWGIGSLAGGFNEPGPGPKMGILGVAEGFCCVPPWTGHMLAFSPIFLSAFLYNTLCSKHKDMEFPPWAGAALVMTDKGVIGRRHFGPDSKSTLSLGAASTSTETSGFAPTTRAGAPQARIPIPPSFWDPLVCGLYFGLLVPCCRCICIQPKEPGLYRATIFSKHTTTVWTGESGQIRGDTDWKYRSPRAGSLAGRVEKLAPRVEREVPGLIAATTVEHNFGVWCGRLGISTFRSDTGRAEVGSVKSCSKAESYGMQVGDTVLELDGQRVDHGAFRAGLAAARRQKRTVRLLIARGDARPGRGGG